MAIPGSVYLNQSRVHTIQLATSLMVEWYLFVRQSDAYRRRGTVDSPDPFTRLLGLENRPCRVGGKCHDLPGSLEKTVQ